MSNGECQNNRDETWSYDALGDVTNDSRDAQTYDAEGRQVRTESLANPNEYTKLSYDGDGGQVRFEQKIANGLYAGGYQTVIRYRIFSSVWGQVLTEIDQSGQKQETYVQTFENQTVRQVKSYIIQQTGTQSVTYPDQVVFEFGDPLGTRSRQWDRQTNSYKDLHVSPGGVPVETINWQVLKDRFVSNIQGYLSYAQSQAHYPGTSIGDPLNPVNVKIDGRKATYEEFLRLAQSGELDKIHIKGFGAAEFGPNKGGQLPGVSGHYEKRIKFTPDKGSGVPLGPNEMRLNSGSFTTSYEFVVDFIGSGLGPQQATAFTVQMRQEVRASLNEIKAPACRLFFGLDDTALVEGYINRVNFGMSDSTEKIPGTNRTYKEDYGNDPTIALLAWSDSKLYSGETRAIIVDKTNFYSSKQIASASPGLGRLGTNLQALQRGVLRHEFLVHTTLGLRHKDVFDRWVKYSPYFEKYYGKVGSGDLSQADAFDKFLTDCVQNVFPELK